MFPSYRKLGYGFHGDIIGFKGPFAVGFEDNTVREAKHLMAREGLGRLPVLKSDNPGHLVAILSDSDIRSAVRRHLEEADQAERVFDPHRFF